MKQALGLTLALGLVSLTVGMAAATPVYLFDGTVTWAQHYEPFYNGPPIPHVGDHFTGYFYYTFGNVVYPVAVPDPTSAIYAPDRDPSLLVDFAVHFTGITLGSNLETFIRIDNGGAGSTADSFTVINDRPTGYPNIFNDPFSRWDRFLSITLTDTTGTAFSDTSLPRELDLSAFDERTISYFAGCVGPPYCDGALEMTGTIDHIFAVPAPIPEPSTFLLLGSGLAGLGGVAWRRSRKR